MRTFPILVSFDGKPPLVTGGGELAAVKTRLLLKRASLVEVAADEVTPELAALIEAGAVALIAARARHRSVARTPARHCRNRGRRGRRPRLGHCARARRAGERSRQAGALQLRTSGDRRSRRGDGRDRHFGRIARSGAAPARMARTGAASTARCARQARGRVPRRRGGGSALGSAAAKILGGRVRGRRRRSHARGR